MRYATLLAAGLSAILCAIRFGRVRRLLPATLIAIALVDAHLFAAGYNGTTDRRQWYPADPLLTRLARPSPQRMIGYGTTLPAETAVRYGLYDARGYDALEPAWVMRYLRETGLFHALDFPLLERPTLALDLLGVSHVLTPPIDLPPLWLRAVEAGESMDLVGQTGRDVLRLTVYTGVSRSTKLRPGDVAAELVVTTVGGETHRFALRFGRDTGALEAADARPGEPPAHATFEWPSLGPVRVFRTTFELPGMAAIEAMTLRAPAGEHAVLVVRVQTTPSRWDDANPGYVHVVGHAGGRIYRNPWALPRCFLAPRIERVHEELIYDRIRNEAVDPRQVVLVPADCDVELAAHDDGPPGTAEILDDHPEHVVVRTRAVGDRVLFLSDTWFPGWVASVDGVERPIHRAFGAFRAVVVPAGEHEVAFTYRPRSFLIGRTLSTIGLVLLAGLGVAHLVATMNRRRKG